MARVSSGVNTADEWRGRASGGLPFVILLRAQARLADGHDEFKSSVDLKVLSGRGQVGKRRLVCPDLPID